MLADALQRRTSRPQSAKLAADALASPAALATLSHGPSLADSYGAPLDALLLGVVPRGAHPAARHAVAAAHRAVLHLDGQRAAACHAVAQLEQATVAVVLVSDHRALQRVTAGHDRTALPEAFATLASLAALVQHRAPRFADTLMRSVATT